MLLATWNVLADSYIRPDYYPNINPQLLEPVERRKRVISRLTALNSDIACVQEIEVGLFEELKRLLAPMGYVAHLAMKGQGKPDGCATFVRHAASTSTTHTYEDGSGHIALVTRVTVGAVDFVVANTHLKWGDPRHPAEQRPCVQQARSLAMHLSATPQSLVVCGDLNVTPGDDALTSLMSPLVLTDAFDGDDEPHTCAANGRTARIDHVLVRGFIARPVRQPSATGRVLPDDIEPSDHLPLVTELKLT